MALCSHKLWVHLLALLTELDVIFSMVTICYSSFLGQLQSRTSKRYVLHETEDVIIPLFVLSEVWHMT